jgi:hypothetical protein
MQVSEPLASGACVAAEKTTVTAAPPGAMDQVSGRAGAAGPRQEVTIFADEALTNSIGSATSEEDGSFGAVAIGDNERDKVWVMSGGAACKAVALENDIVAPTTNLTQTPPAIMETPEAHFIFEGSEKDCTFRCQIDMGEAVACTSPYVLSGLSDGSHELRIMATDPAGNEEIIGQEFALMWDSSTPVVKFVTTPGTVSGQDVSFSFQCSKSDCLVECQLDEQVWGPCASPHALTGLPQGKHSFRLRLHLEPDAPKTDPLAFYWKVRSSGDR